MCLDFGIQASLRLTDDVSWRQVDGVACHNPAIDAVVPFILCVNKWMNSYLIDWLIDWMNEWMNERVNEWMGE